jgi:hypothetical protein
MDRVQRHPKANHHVVTGNGMSRQTPLPHGADGGVSDTGPDTHGGSMLGLVTHPAIRADQRGEPFVLSVTSVFPIELFVQRRLVLVFVQRNFDLAKIFT